MRRTPPATAVPAAAAAAASTSGWGAKSSLSTAALLGGVVAWVHGWLTGIMHEHVGAHNMRLMALVALPLIVIVGRHPIGRRVLAAGVYALAGAVVMSLASGVAWYRNPKHAGHLPDVLHDLVPYLEEVELPGTSALSGTGANIKLGGIELAEHLMFTLIAATLAFSLWQPCRWLLLRRAMIVYGTLALWRSVTVLVTAVPDASPRCTVTTPGTVPFLEVPWREALKRGLSIFVNDSADPCRSAGDMVFSGHTMAVVLCGMVWHSYYRVKPGTFVINPVKLLVWLHIAVILFTIVASRYHYTLDVVLATYFAVTLFNAYHRIADDVLVGHRYVAVWLFDGLIIYPAIEWMEAPWLGESVRGGMLSTNTQMVSALATARTAMKAAQAAAGSGSSSSSGAAAGGTGGGGGANPSGSSGGSGTATPSGSGDAAAATSPAACMPPGSAASRQTSDGGRGRWGATYDSAATPNRNGGGGGGGGSGSGGGDGAGAYSSARRLLRHPTPSPPHAHRGGGGRCDTCGAASASGATPMHMAPAAYWSPRMAGRLPPGATPYYTAASGGGAMSGGRGRASSSADVPRGGAGWYAATPAFAHLDAATVGGLPPPLMMAPALPPPGSVFALPRATYGADGMGGIDAAAGGYYVSSFNGVPVLVPEGSPHDDAGVGGSGGGGGRRYSTAGMWSQRRTTRAGSASTTPPRATVGDEFAGLLNGFSSVLNATMAKISALNRDVWSGSPRAAPAAAIQIRGESPPPPQRHPVSRGARTSLRCQRRPRLQWIAPPCRPPPPPLGRARRRQPPQRPHRAALPPWKTTAAVAPPPPAALNVGAAVAVAAVVATEVVAVVRTAAVAVVCERDSGSPVMCMYDLTRPALCFVCNEKGAPPRCTCPSPSLVSVPVCSLWMSV